MTFPIFPTASLQALAAAAETGSFTEAGKVLGLSQSAVSQAIDRLERQFGLALFDRSSRPMALTPEGRELAGIAKKFLLDAEFLADAAARLKAGEAQSVRIGITAVVDRFIGPDIEAALIPKTKRFEAIGGISSEINRAYLADEIDAAVAYGIPRERRIIGFPLLTERYLIVCPKSTGAEEDEMPIARLKPCLSLPFVAYRQLATDWANTKVMRRLLSIPAEDAVSLQSSAAVAAAVTNGLGWTIMSPLALWAVRDKLDGVSVHGLGSLSSEKTLWSAAGALRYRGFAEAAAAVFKKWFVSKWLPEMAEKKPAVIRYVRLHDADGSLGAPKSDSAAASAASRSFAEKQQKIISPRQG